MLELDIHFLPLLDADLLSLFGLWDLYQWHLALV